MEEAKQYETDQKESLGLLTDAGLSEEEAKKVLSMSPEQRTDFLAARFDPELTGRPLAGLLKAIHRLGDREKVADFLVDVIYGKPTPAQLMALQIADRPEFRSIDKVDDALNCYQADFENLNQAYSHYNDKEYCGCESRGCKNG